MSYWTWDGSLSLTYDPDNERNDLFVGTVVTPAGPMSFGAGGRPPARVSLSLVGDSFYLGGDDGNIVYSTIRVTLTGDPGPLNAQGLPLSLDGFLDQPPQVTGTASSPTGWFVRFDGLAGVPEPSSLLMLSLGFGGTALCGVASRNGP
jgi:hypothetical protein